MRRMRLAEELAYYVQENGSRLEIDIEVPEAEVTCDLFRIEQVLTNLINNALQHNTKPVAITLRARAEPDAFYLEVEDNGKGIESDHIDKLFDRFFQESRSRTHDENRANVGLGLSVAQAIVQAHKGTITVTSESGIRTRFTISIPQSSLSLK
ncbi:MAG: ATP-binding protein [Verrucomicrobiota bacterium]